MDALALRGLLQVCRLSGSSAAGELMDVPALRGLLHAAASKTRQGR